MRIIIPARKGSKGFPDKNLKLFEYTAMTIPDEYSDRVTVLTDDHRIQEIAEIRGFKWIGRPSEVSNDTASTKSLVKWYIDSHDIDELLVVLYLTYPERTWSDIEQAISLLKSSNSSSLLCKKEINSSPFLMLKEEGELHGSQLFYHDLYRRQDYPNCFEISHYIIIINSKFINKLNNNLYCRDTVFMSVSKNVIDVDYEKNLSDLNGIP